MGRFLVFLVISMAWAPSFAQQRPLETIRVVEFLSLPESIQAIYVAGLLDGISFVAYGNNDPSLGAWINCVRQVNLGQTTIDVVNFLEETPIEQREPVPWALSQVIGNRNCPR